LTDICPERIIRASSATTDEATSNTVELLPSSNTAYLQRIIFNVHEPVLLRLLVCKEEKNTEEPDDCPYPGQRNREAVKKACGDTEKKLAQIYLRHEKFDKKARSCVIVFVEGEHLSQTGKLLEIFRNTVEWLKIADERPYFYVLRYGHPQDNLTTKNAGDTLNNKMRELFEGYSKDEEICHMVPVERGAKPLIINHTRKFSIRAS
jgi:hypothetical protein